MKTFEATRPDEARTLAGELMMWGAAIEDGESVTLWDHIEKQIKFHVFARNEDGQTTSPEEFVEYMFSPNFDGDVTADIIMTRLQIG